MSKWANDVVRHPKLVEAVKTFLGSEDILVWSCDLNVKKAGTKGFFSWHQDSTYAGLEPASQVLTAWVAVSDAKAESGCLRFLAKTHREQLEHEETRSEDNMLAFGQTVKDKKLLGELTPKAVTAELEAGQASFHGFRCVHASGANEAGYDRVGLAVRYLHRLTNYFFASQ